jgi:membrane protein YdbS with pleckstrin-like domain
MSLFINQDGNQLGPYSLDEVRALVLSGKLAPSDWAWLEGAKEWIPLKDVPGLSPAPPAQPAPPAAPSAPATAVAAPEQELWHGHPSQVLNFDVYAFWAIVLIVALVVAVALVYSQECPQEWAIVLFGIVALVALIITAAAYFHLRAIEYVVTTQRVRVVSGIFSKDVQEIELFRVKDTMARQSFFLRLFGLGTITILSGDERHPRIVLSGVPQAIELREKLRQEVMTLRQRFGVREVDVM